MVDNCACRSLSIARPELAYQPVHRAACGQANDRVPDLPNDAPSGEGIY
jgi:hypothetical protein